MSVASQSYVLESMARSLKALADPTRLRIFTTLMEGTHCNCELVDALQLTPNLISHHLRVLSEADLIQAEREQLDARWIYYSVNKTALERLGALFGTLFAVERIQTRQPTCGPARTILEDRRMEKPVGKTALAAITLVGTADEELPLVCDIGAIDAGNRANHISLARDLLSERALERRETVDGYEFSFRAEDYARVVEFVANERLCCSFLHFTLDVPPAKGELILHIRAEEGARAVLLAELNLA